MIPILNFFNSIFNNIVSILNTEFFPDFPVSFLDLILVTIILRYVFRFLFGGFKEVEGIGNYQNYLLVSRSMSNATRRAQLAHDESLKRRKDNVFSGNVSQKRASESQIAELDNLFDSL